MLLNEDLPHPIPTRAWLRWRENWLYFLVDEASGVIVTAHMSLQPTFGIARYAVNLIIDGERISFAEEVPCKEPLSQKHTITLGRLQVDFTVPRHHIDVTFDGPDHRVTLRLEPALPLFDYADCIDTNPDEYSLAESTSLGFGTFRHHNQTMRGKGTLSFTDGRPSREIGGVGYRDHSWGMRDDTLTKEHIWAWAVFKDMTLHVTRVLTRLRPTLWVSEGYIGRPDGNLAISQCTAEFSQTSQDNLPGLVRLEGSDPDGNKILVTCDLVEAFARNRFLSQHAGADAYLMKHTFCHATNAATGEKGIAMVEIGRFETGAAAILTQGR